MSDNQILELFKPITDEFDRDFFDLISRKPLLAHYTSLSVLEKIMKTEEIWFSNPLFMNDLEEIRFGINEGMNQFLTSSKVSECCATDERTQLMRHAVTQYYQKFDNEHALNLYVFCLSEHDAADNDGLLSMWRGYGGFGSGAALVFNTEFIKEPQLQSPIAICKVRYASKDHRIARLDDMLGKWCTIVKSANIPDEKLYIAGYQLFQLIKIFALIFKHDGFREEREWRLIYLPERDVNGLLKNSFDYIIGSRGVEPKLKFKISPLPIEKLQTWNFESILDRIILGPSVSSPLARLSIARMLDMIGKENFRTKVISSTIPLRPT